eukprot:jgi/Psemu1/307826/fgenesh1_kg.355_\
MDRVARAATALTVLWEEKSGLAAEAAEAQAARRVRERAARGTCMICLDEKPNIATLCCGNAIHLNCCAEWLSGNNRCPICRHEMPSISGRVVQAMEEPRVNNGDHRPGQPDRRNPAAYSREYQNFVDRFWTEIGNNNRGHPIPANRTVSMSDRFWTQIGNSSRGHPIPANRNAPLAPVPFSMSVRRSSIQDNDNDNDSYDGSARMHLLRRYDDPEIPDETTTESSDNNGQNNQENDNSTTEEDVENSDNSDTTTTTTDESDGNGNTTASSGDSSQGARRHVNAFCATSGCRNRHAVDCENLLCGRCCVLHGGFRCARHNT